MKKLSPQSVNLLKNALAVIYWKKSELRDFVKIVLDNHPIIATIDWNQTKRESVNELISRMINRNDIYFDHLFRLTKAVIDINDFSHLEYWDDRGVLMKEAADAVNRLRNQAKGFFEIQKEIEEVEKRRKEAAKKVALRSNLSNELKNLHAEFLEIAKTTNKQKRGFLLEPFINKLFNLYDLNPRASFKHNGEQLDGAFTFDGTDYLIEAKWKQQVNRGDLAAFCHKVETKLKATMGLLVTIDGLTSEAISEHFKSVIIMDGIDMIAILENRVSLTDLLYRKRRRASETGEIYCNYYELMRK